MQRLVGILRRPRVAVGLGLVAVVLLARPPVAQRLTGLFFAPRPGPATPPPELAGAVEEVRFRAADGASLEGWWFPATAPSDAQAVVMFAHGNGWNLEKQWRLAAHLAPRGFHVLAFDYRGFGDSPGRASRKAAREDVLAALEEAQARARALDLPVVAAGQSMGAALVLEALAGRDDVAAIVADSPFSSWSEIASWHLVDSRWARRGVRLALASLLSATGTDPVAAAPRIVAPLLVIGGESDDITPPHMARAIAEAAGAEILMLAEAGHPGRRPEDAESEVADAEARFFAAAVSSARLPGRR